MNTDVMKSVIQFKINGHQLKISKLEKMLAIYEEMDTHEEEDKVIPVKRKYVRSGKYSKNKKLSVSPKTKKVSFTKGKRIKWGKILKKVLASHGKPMNTKEIMVHLFSGKDKSTLRILKRRLSVILTLYKNSGVLKTNKNGRGLKYGLPYMFKK